MIRHEGRSRLVLIVSWWGIFFSGQDIFFPRYFLARFFSLENSLQDNVFKQITHTTPASTPPPRPHKSNGQPLNRKRPKLFLRSLKNSKGNELTLASFDLQHICKRVVWYLGPAGFVPTYSVQLKHSRRYFQKSVVDSANHWFCLFFIPVIFLRKGFF